MSHRWRFYKLICYLKLIGKTNINWEILGYIYLIVSLSVFITFFITLFLVLIDCFVVLSCFFLKVEDWKSKNQILRGHLQQHGIVAAASADPQ